MPHTFFGVETKIPTRLDDDVNDIVTGPSSILQNHSPKRNGKRKRGDPDVSLSPHKSPNLKIGSNVNEHTINRRKDGSNVSEDKLSGIQKQRRELPIWDGEARCVANSV
jgi:hypothetical protein